MVSTRRTAIIAALAALAVLLGSGPASAATVVARWNMDDGGSTMADATGRGHTGTLHNVAVKQPGLDGSSFGFSGPASSVSVPASPDFTPGAADFRIQLSLRFTEPPSAAVGTYDLLRMGLSTTAGGDYKVEIRTSGRAVCLFRGSAGAGYVTGGPDLSDGGWHTLVCSRTASSVVLTVDGLPITKAVHTGSITSSTAVSIGAKTSTGADQYRGFLDSISISKG